MIYRFETFEFDTSTAELRNGDAVIPLEPKSFHLLRYLLDNADRVVSKDEILDHVWRNRIVSETTLSTCIKSIRKAVEDSGEAQRLIQTARGHGYRFIGEVSHKDESEQISPQPTSNLTSLAILPFQIFSPQPELDFFADGLVEDLTTILAHVPGLSVISRSSSFSFKGTSPATSKVREDLGVSHVLEGSVRANNERVRINVQLIDATTQDHVWARRFDSEMSSLSTTEDDVIREVARYIEPELTRITYERVSRHQSDPQARHLYVQASGLLAIRGWHEDTFVEATALLRQCINLDPRYAVAHAHLAVMLALGHRVGLLDNPQEVMQEAIAAADQAMELDHSNSEVLGFVGCALCDVGESDRGLPLLEQAVEMDPSNAQAWAALGASQINIGQLTEATKNLTHGIKISPLDSRLAVWGGMLATSLAISGDIEGAVSRAETACRQDPANYLPALTLAAIQCSIGDMEAARQAFTHALRIRPKLSDHEIRAVVGRRMRDALKAADIITDQ